MNDNSEPRNVNDQSDILTPITTLKIHGHESEETKQEMELQFRGLSIKNVEKGFFNLTRTDPFIVLSKKHNDNHYQAIYKSEHIQDHLNPLWESVIINLEQLCDGDRTKTLRIELFDYEPDGRHRLVCHVKDVNLADEDLLNVNRLIERSEGLRGNGDKSKSLILVEESNEDIKAGELIVLMAKVINN